MEAALSTSSAHVSRSKCAEGELTRGREVWIGAVCDRELARDSKLEVEKGADARYVHREKVAVRWPYMQRQVARAQQRRERRLRRTHRGSSSYSVRRDEMPAGVPRSPTRPVTHALVTEVTSHLGHACSSRRLDLSAEAKLRRRAFLVPILSCLRFQHNGRRRRRSYCSR